MHTHQLPSLCKAIGMSITLALAGCGGRNSETSGLQNSFSREQCELKYPSANTLLLKLHTLPGFEAAKISHVSKTPGAPTIIILSDNHGSPEIERKKLTLLRDQCGINFVGLEGWAGAKADKDRQGFQIHNGEMDLITDIIKDSHFVTAGLENKEVQERALFALFMYHFLLTHEATQLKEYVPRNNIERIDRDIEMSDTAESESMASDALKVFNIDGMNADQFFGFLHKVVFPRFNIVEEDLFFNENDTYQTYKKRMNALQDRFADDAAIYGDLMLEQRSHIGAQLMLSHIRAAGVKIGVMVFGSLHVEQIANDLKAADVTVIQVP